MHRRRAHMTCKLTMNLRGNIGDGGAPCYKRLNGARAVCGEMDKICSGTDVFGGIRIEGSRWREMMLCGLISAMLWWMRQRKDKGES